jgi:hypothetical protein
MIVATVKKGKPELRKKGKVCTDIWHMFDGWNATNLIFIVQSGQILLPLTDCCHYPLYTII